MEKPECRGGYTDEQVRRIMGPRYDEFQKWMYGQTFMICQGEAGCDRAHGSITYVTDIRTFLAGRAPLD